MNDIENQVRNILTAFWYNNSDEDMRTLCSELKIRIASRVVEKDELAQYSQHPNYGDIIVSLMVLMFGEYGTSPRYGWIPKEQADFIVNVINKFESDHFKEA